MLSKIAVFIIYFIRYCLLNVLCPIIPHPKMRTAFLRVLGAEIGWNVRIENVKFIQIQGSIKNFRCRDNVFIGTGVIIDLSAAISIGPNSLVSPSCSLITHQDAGEFFNSKLSWMYSQKYLPIVIKDEVWVGCDSTVLPGTTNDSFTVVVGAKSLVRGQDECLCSVEGALRVAL